MPVTTLARARVADITRRSPVLVDPDTPTGVVVEQMVAGGRGNAVIVDDDGAPVGMFTQRDVVSRLDLTNDRWRRAPIREFLSPGVVTVGEDDSLHDCLVRMRQRDVRSLPVCTGGRVIGVVSIRDILRYVAECFPKEFINLPPDPSSEPSGAWGG